MGRDGDGLRHGALVVGRRAVRGAVRPGDGRLVRDRRALDEARAGLGRHPGDGLSGRRRRRRRRHPARDGDDDEDGGGRPADGRREVRHRPARPARGAGRGPLAADPARSTPRTCRSSGAPTPRARTSGRARRTWTSCARPRRSPSGARSPPAARGRAPPRRRSGCSPPSGPRWPTPGSVSWPGCGSSCRDSARWARGSPSSPPRRARTCWSPTSTRRAARARTRGAWGSCRPTR